MPPSPLSPAVEQHHQQPSHNPHAQDSIQSGMVVDQMDVMQQQQSNIVDPMNQYRNNGTNNGYPQCHSSPDQIRDNMMCVGAGNEHDVTMNDYNSGMLRKIKVQDDSGMHMHSQQMQSPYILSAGPSDNGNSYGMNLKQEPEVNF